MEWFRSRTEAKVITESWRKYYNQIGTHSSLRYLTPNEFIEHFADTSAQHVML
tara:strand:+ start:5859 stop:6017 length:159 start_codon:yes stop_codon:yes gene_type:complete